MPLELVIVFFPLNIFNIEFMIIACFSNMWLREWHSTARFEPLYLSLTLLTWFQPLATCHYLLQSFSVLIICHWSLLQTDLVIEVLTKEVNQLLARNESIYQYTSYTRLLSQWLLRRKTSLPFLLREGSATILRVDSVHCCTIPYVVNSCSTKAISPIIQTLHEGVQDSFSVQSAPRACLCFFNIELALWYLPSAL